MYRTGDLARYRSDGNIEFLGRIDHQVKIRGFRIELGEIEACLRQHPSIREALVMAGGEDGDKRLLAYVVTDDPPPSREALRTYIRVNLPEYMLPAAFVFLDALPLTPNGKVDRKALPVPDSHRPDLAQSYVAARTPIEVTLVRLWSEVLGVERIGVEDDFFMLGGHSLKLLELATRIESTVGQRLPITSLFSHATVSAQARLLDPQGTSASRQSAIVPLRTDGTGPALLWVHPIGGSALCYRPLANALEINHPLYALQSPWFGRGEECPTTLEQIAATYLNLIEETFGDEPLLLGGWSFGALLALEIAQQLAHRGRAPLRLLLVDPTDPSPGDDHGDTACEEVVAARIVLTDLYHSQRAAVSPDLATDTLPQINSLDDAFALGKHHGLLPAGLSALEFRGLIELYRRHITAVNRYTPTPYLGASSLYRATTPPAAAGEPDGSNWKVLLTGPLAVQAIPATHYSLLQPPAVNLLAAHIQHELDAGQWAECGDAATTAELALEQESSLETLTNGDST
jgi:thioesterase domain-containing protein/acyl carrier protein